MGRETYLADLYRQSVQALTQNRTEWMGLLSSVSKYYKMSFDKNVLIYVQRPDAGLLATKMGWEKQTGRYLKAGSKGIGVVDMNNPKATLAYYFDLADTRGDYEGFRRAMSAVWSLERQYQPEILDRFHKQFGTDENSIENCLCQLVGMQADAFFEKYLSRVEVKDENSVLYGLPAGAVQAEFAKLVSDSAAYIVFKKCGIKAEIFEETGAFENISHFGSLELFMGLGYYTCAIARSVLSEIHKQIEEIKEERSQRYEPRTVSETGIHERGGRDAVSEPSDIREQGVRLKTDRDVREKMEGLHDVEVPAETVGVDRTGADKRADSQGGRGSRSEERNADSAASGGTADAGDRGYAGESRTHGDDNQTGGGDHPARSSVPVKIAEKEEAAEPEPVKKNTEKASEESEAEHAAEGSSFHIPQSATKENIREHKDWEEVQSLLTDTGVFPLELYDRINQVFAKETDPAVKRNAVRDIYLDYGLQKSSDGTRGIMPGKDVADFFFGEEGFVRLSWDVITHVIGSLMQNSEYIPYHEEEDAIGDFNIPDEIEDMQLGSRKDHEDGQLSLFELYPGPYEDDGKGGDQILPEETEPEEIKSGYMPFPVGSRIAYDDRIFEVLQYLDDNHTVELGDIEQLQGLHGYKVIERLPVVLIENAELLQPNYTEGEVAQTVVQSVEDKGLNYHYQPEHRLYEGGPKAKFRNNVEAIRLLKQLQQENRIATTEEQIVLARFVGWGGLANALTPGKEGWEKEYDEISELLTEEEMQSASASTLTSYYTDQKVIEFIYQALYQFGFRSGNIMDPALGTGNFFSALPESMNQSRLYGVELEPIAGGIARKLYPQADILIKGYEDTEFSDSFFDVVVGNVPFHNIKVSDRRYDRYNFKIHDYFLAKSLDMPKTADNVEEALRITMNAKGKFDLDYMQYLYRKDGQICSKEDILEELGERVYQDPAKWRQGDATSGWVLAEEYLSGYVKDKLAQAVLAEEEYPEWFGRNVEALKKVQPEPLKPEDISFVLGSTWIPVKYYQDFMYEKFATSKHNRDSNIHIEFAEYTGTYFITEKRAERDSIAANKTYGTERLNAYEIMEYTLNLKTVEVRDRQEYEDPVTGEEKVRYVLNKRETLLAREKQAQIKMEFESWLFAEPERGAALTQLYNDRFNNIRPRTYNGDDLMLPDMNDAITLRKHQRDTVAMGIYSDGNLLVAHEVGAGKTMTACAIAYERKRLGVCNKPLIAVPNHTLEQWATEFMRLYPNANILVATNKDFEKPRRRRFVSRIATGDYDCIIMGHSSFELIALSRERQLATMQEEIDEITKKIDEMKMLSGKTWSLKQMEIFRHNLQDRFDRLYNAGKKDGTISFEELGVDNLFVDEAHAYKNNYSYTKMQRVAGVGGQSSQRAMDMHMKCQYINEITNEHGVVYLTGTPVSNSMSELYVMQKTLQPSELKRRGLLMFDSWASTFGKVESSLEIKPEGSGYQMKARFAKFHNLPELMSMLFLVADIKTADMLDLPVPKLKTGKMQVVKTAITPDQKAIMEELVERAEAIRNKEVDSSQDNFLKLTNEARLLSVDPRILDETLDNDPDTKLNACARGVAEIYHDTEEQHSTQLIFCDKGTPKADGRFNFYQALRQEMVRLGVEEKEIAFIHDANTDTKRAELLEKVRNGIVRVLLGSTEKMGTGLNVQDKLIALHNLDAPWRPADLTQRNGRILRQGNENDEISIFNYITEQTFDAYLWQILEQKQRYISQIMTGRSALRSCEDVDEVVLQYAEFKALAVSDPKIKRKMEVDNEVYRLQTLKSAWKSEHTDLQNKITVYYPQEIKKCTERIEHRKADAELYQKEVPQEFSITLNHRLFDERTKAGEYLKMQMANLGHEAGDTVSAGTYAGLQVMLKRGAFQDVLLCLKGEGSYQVDAGESALGNITRLENLAEKIPQYLKDEERKLGELKEQFEAAKVQAERPFSEEEKLSEFLKEQVSLNLELEFADADEEGMEKAGKSHGNSIYRKLRKLAPELFEGTYTYMKFKQDGFDDLVLETIGENEYSIAHYYTQNGDRMRDPEITFMLDDTQRCIYALSYTQDNMGIYYETGDRTEKQMEDLMGFFDQWMANIKEQGFTLYKAYGEDAEYTKEEEHTEEMGYTVISADNLKQMNRFDGEDMENER